MLVVYSAVEVEWVEQVVDEKAWKAILYARKVRCSWQNKAVWYSFYHERLKTRHRTTLGEVLAYGSFAVYCLL